MIIGFCKLQPLNITFQKLKMDLQEYERKFRLLEMFHGKEDNDPS